MSQTGDAPDTESTDPVFAGRAGVARDMAAVDWAATPLGPPAGWPAALRDVVRILLTSRFAMWMAWGPELTMFYNDAYQQATLRRKHPWALGRPFDEVWAEIRQTLTPQIRSVLEDGAATWDEDLQLFLERNGWPEETYHTFSYSPLARRGRRHRGPALRGRGDHRAGARRAPDGLPARPRAAPRPRPARSRRSRPPPATCSAAAVRTCPSAWSTCSTRTPEQPHARLAAAAGVSPDGPAAPPSVELGVPGRAWPARRGRPLRPRCCPSPTTWWAPSPRSATGSSSCRSRPATTSGDDRRAGRAAGGRASTPPGLRRALPRLRRAASPGRSPSGLLDARRRRPTGERADALDGARPGAPAASSPTPATSCARR